MTASTAGLSGFEIISSACDRLGIIRKRPRPGQFRATCPCHEDRTASLDVKYDPDTGNVLILCRAGCDWRDILTELGVPQDAAFGQEPRRPDRTKARAPRPRTPPLPRQDQPRPAEPECLGQYAEHELPAFGRPSRPRPGIDWFPYHDDQGTLITYHVRVTCTRPGCGGRTFRPMTPDTSGRLRQRGPKGIRPLYRLPEFLDDVRAGKPIIICEGETDTEAAAAAGWAATTMGPATQGASTWKPEHTDTIARTANDHVVTIAADRDSGAGRRSALYIAAQLLARGVNIRIVEAADGLKDVRDHIGAGHTLDEMRDITDLVLTLDDEEGPDVTNPEPDPEGSNPDKTLATVTPIHHDQPGGTKKSRPAPFGKKVPTSGRRDIYAVTDNDGQYERGLYIDGDRVSGIPHVISRMMIRDGSDRSKGFVYLLTNDLDTQPRAITGRDISLGAYVDMIGADIPEDRGIRDAAATVIQRLGREAPQEELYARWEDERLILPPAEVLPSNYLRTEGSEDNAHDVWREIGTIASNPDMENTAINIGAAYSSTYIQKLSAVRPVSFALVGVGAPNTGKTTNENVAAAWFGPPIDVNPVISESEISMGDTLAGMGVLPLFRDELHASPMSQQQWKTLFMKNLNGAGRRRSASDGSGIVRSTRGWWGVIFLSGNKDPRFGATDGVIRRVIVLDRPHVSDADTADRITNLIGTAYGWPIRWQAADHPAPEVFRDDITRAQDDLLAEQIKVSGAEPTGPARQVATILAVIIAGAERAGMLIDAPGLRDSAIRGSLRVLGTLADTIADTPMSFDAQLLDVITSDLARNPQAWPTEAEYESMRQGRDTHPGATVSGPFPIRDVHGIQLTHDGRPVAAAIAGEDSWFNQATIGRDFPRGEALAELRRRGLLVTTRRTGYQWSHKINGVRERFYAIRLGTGANAGANGTTPPVGTGYTPSDLHSANGANGANEFHEYPHVSACEEAPDVACLDCGQPINTAVFEGDGIPVHPSCTPRCEQCRREITPGRSIRSRVCWACEQPPTVQPTLNEATDRTQDTETPARPDDPTPVPTAPQRGTQGRSGGTRKDRQAETRTETLDRIATGGPPRFLDALVGPFAPLCRSEGKLRGPYQRPDHPGITPLVATTGARWERPYAGTVTALDRNGAYLAAASSVLIAHGGLDHTGPRMFDRYRCAGYFLIDVHPWHESDRLPSPLGNADIGSQLWVTAPVIALLEDLAKQGRWPDATIIDSYSCNKVARINDWVSFIRDIRAEVIERFSRDSDEYAAVKNGYGQALALLLGSLSDTDGSIRRQFKSKLQRPDWNHAIRGQAAVTMFRAADACLTVAPDAGPVAVRNIDELVLPTTTLDRVTTGERPAVRIDPSGLDIRTFKVKAEEVWTL